MMTTIGQLVAALFAKHERYFHNTELAALATQAELATLTSVRPPSVGVFEARSAASSTRADAWERFSN